MFDLDKSIAAWRRRFERDRAFLAEDVRELEQHIRDHVAALVARGHTEEAAFLLVMREMGEPDEVAAAYRNVLWGKLKRRHALVPHLLAEAAMVQNALRIVGRRLRRQKGYALINIGGLAVGLACCILILLFIRSELRYDRYHEHAQRIFHLVLENDAPGGRRRMSNMPAGLAPAVAQRRPEVEQAVRVGSIGQGANLLSNGTLRAYEEGLFYVDAAVFDVFSFPLVEGDPATALTEPFSIVLDERLAQKYFGDRPALGQSLDTADGRTYRVTGIMRDVPAESHWRPRALVSFETLRSLGRSGLDALNDYFAYQTYFLLRSGADADRLEAALPPLLGGLESGSWSRTARFHLQPLPDVYLHSLTDRGPQGSVTALYVFSAAALLILLIACVNYTNLATAWSLQRAREVGIRKAVGAQRARLVLQFLAESVGLSLLAACLGLLLAVAALPLFNRLSGKEIELVFSRDGWLVLSLLGTGAVVGILSGSYPALLLSGVRPVAVLKGQAWAASGGLLRKGLVTFQFVITVVLITCTLTMQRQLDFAQDVRLGVRSEQLVALAMDRESPAGTRVEALEAELRRRAGVLEVSAASAVPTRLSWRTRLQRLEGVPGEVLEAQYIAPVSIAPDYVETLGLRLVAGRGFSAGRDRRAADDTLDVPFLVNEAFVRAFGLAEPVGAAVQFGNQHGRIVGVVEDAYFTSVHEAVPPLLFRPLQDRADFVLVRFDGEGAAGVVQALQAAWPQFDADRPLDYFFLDEAFAQLYVAERRLTGIFAAFAGLAIFVACLGLFGLAAHAAERRTKEIGVRKVLGASVASVVVLLSKSFVQYVLAASVVAFPIAHFAMSRWLEGFAYRVELGAGTFALAGGLALLVALLTVNVQAVKAALADPVKSLRYE